MPSRNLPPLGSLQTSGRGVMPGDVNRPEVNVVQLYEESGDGRREYVYGRPRELSGTIANVVVVQNEADLMSKGLHLPSVNASPSALGSKSRLVTGEVVSGASRGGIVLSPDTAVQRYAQHLTSYERREIFNYTSVYFVGPSAIKLSGVAGAPNNDGFDDEQGSYLQVGHVLNV
jgi:hypothetical protein